MSENKVVDIILHCQKQIKKERLPEEKLLHYLGRLSRLRVTVQDLAETGIGRTVNSLSRNDGPVGQAADTLVRGWKRMVSEQQNQEAERESEEESDSNSGSSEEEEEEEEVNTTENAPYELDEPEESQSQERERRFNNGHSGYEDCRPPNDPPAPHQSRSYHDDDDVDEDLNDDIDDPYMENGFMSIANVHSDGDDDEEENDDKDADSDASERLEIDADDNDDQPNRHIDEKPPNFYVKQERQQLDERDQKSSHSSKNHSNQKYESDHKKQSSSNSSSSSKSHRDPERSSEKSQSKEHKHHYRSSSKESSSKDRSKHSSSGSSEQQGSSKHKSHHSSSSSKAEKSKESKSEHDKNHRHHKEKDRHHRSKESSSSSHRDKEKEIKSEKERSSKDKKDSVDSPSKSSSSSHKSKVPDPTSSLSQSPKKSSLESSVKKEVSSHSSQDDRKRKEHSSNSPCDSSSSKKSKIVLKEEVDSNSGINFSDVLGSLDVPLGSSSSKHSSSKKDKKRDDHEKSHKKHHESHHSSSSSKKRHDSPSSSKHSSRDAGSSSSKKSDRDSSDASKVSKKAMAQSKIESVIQPVVNISPNYKPMSSSLPKVTRVGAVSSSSSSNGIAIPPPIPLSSVDLSDLGSVEYWENNGKSVTSDMSHEDAISTMLSSRNARSKVFSGAKNTRRGEVSSLYDLCMQVIKDNIGDLGYTGGIPYDILKPALERANPQQLISIESQNDYLIGETDELWQFHCKRDFRGKVPAETESWRELYERCTDERQQRFEVIKKQMKRNIEKAEPVRKAKLAYVDTTCTTRFSKQKAQTIKNGMKTLKIKEEKGPSRGVSSSASAGFNNPKKSGDSSTVHVEEASVIIAPESRAGHAPAPSVSREASAAKLKPKKAPLMQKTMKLIKSLHRR